MKNGLEKEKREKTDIIVVGGIPVDVSHCPRLKAVFLVPRSVPRSGENPAVKKSQHKSPLIFFYAVPPFSGLAIPT